MDENFEKLSGVDAWGTCTHAEGLWCPRDNCVDRGVQLVDCLLAAFVSKCSETLLLLHMPSYPFLPLFSYSFSSPLFFFTKAFISFLGLWRQMQTKADCISIKNQLHFQRNSVSLPPLPPRCALSLYLEKAKCVILHKSLEEDKE